MDSFSPREKESQLNTAQQLFLHQSHCGVQIHCAFGTARRHRKTPQAHLGLRRFRFRALPVYFFDLRGLNCPNLCGQHKKATE